MMSALQVIDLITTKGGTNFAPAGRMASAIIEIVNTNGECHDKDLVRQGFTAEEIRTHWHMAQALASAELNLM